LAKLVEILEEFFSDEGSIPSVSTESNSVSPEDEFDSAPVVLYIWLMNKTSDVLSKFYVYTLLSLKDQQFYTGFTTDLKVRLVQHAKGQVKSTRIRRPFKLIHHEYFANEGDAKSRERFLKSGFGRRQLKEALNRTLRNT